MCQTLSGFKSRRRPQIQVRPKLSSWALFFLPCSMTGNCSLCLEFSSKWELYSGLRSLQRTLNALRLWPTCLPTFTQTQAHMYLFYCRDWRKRENSNPYFNLLAFLVRKRTLEKKINYTFPKNQAWGVKKIAFKNWLDNYPPPPQFRTKTIMNIQIFAVFICMMIPVFLSSNSDFQSFMVFIEFLPSVLSFPPPSTLFLLLEREIREQWFK